jgi:hypothetical protein
MAAYAKNPKPVPPASRAASDTMTLTGLPVSMSSEPACAANASGSRSCEGGRVVRSATTTTIGSNAATAPFGVISAVSTAPISITTTSSRARPPPARPVRACPTQVVTPDASMPSLTTNSDAMKMMMGSPKPASASSALSRPVA